ncbi:hypothetical protein HXX01_01070 [Candidatus Nomurabacteria bacterium]|nr:hypothetical protein [Candidatus Nomurabacteria bacterium]
MNNKIYLPNVTLLGIDCVDTERLIKALDISSEQIEFADVKLLTSLPTSDKRKVLIPHIGSTAEYSEFCIRKLADYVDTDFVLIVQYDGFVLNPSSWTNEFLNYDYIGAPWFVHDEFWFTKFLFPRDLLDKTVVGNGGFCLRSKKFLEVSSRLADEGVFDKYHPEDVALCVWNKDKMEKEGIRFAPNDIAEKFSIEGGDHIYRNQFGFHGFKWTDISLWIKENPKWRITQTLENSLWKIKQ